MAVFQQKHLKHIPQEQAEMLFRRYYRWNVFGSLMPLVQHQLLVDMTIEMAKLTKDVVLGGVELRDKTNEIAALKEQLKSKELAASKKEAELDSLREQVKVSQMSGSAGG